MKILKKNELKKHITRVGIMTLQELNAFESVVATANIDVKSKHFLMRAIRIRGGILRDGEVLQEKAALVVGSEVRADDF